MFENSLSQTGTHILEQAIFKHALERINMIELGKTQTLQVIKSTDFGIYLNSEDTPDPNNVLLPKKQIPEGITIGDQVTVFIYKDSEDRLIATTAEPKIKLNEISVLKVKESGNIGAFLDWGLAKDLLLPFKEQTYKVQAGDEVLVMLYIDKSNRLCASMKVYHHLLLDSPYKKDDKVTGIVYEIINEFGAFVAVDNKYSALIPPNELFSSLKPGDKVEARITSIKEDGKLNLSTREKSYLQMDQDAELIYKKLQENGGFLPYHDKSDSEDIKAMFNLSKNAFKRSIGRLMKQEKITIGSDGISLK